MSDQENGIRYWNVHSQCGGSAHQQLFVSALSRKALLASTWPHSVYTTKMPQRLNSSIAAFSAEARRTFYEGHRSLALFMLLLVCAAPFAGLYVAGLFGVVVGVVVSAAAYVLTPCLWKWIGG